MGTHQTGWMRTFKLHDFNLTTTADRDVGSLGALQTNTLPSVRRETTARPFWKSLLRALMTTAGSAASGLVSMAVTNRECGIVPGSGTLL
jgi:hypothetical protein